MRGCDVVNSMNSRLLILVSDLYDDEEAVEAEAIARGGMAFGHRHGRNLLRVGQPDGSQGDDRMISRLR